MLSICTVFRRWRDKGVGLWLDIAAKFDTTEEEIRRLNPNMNVVKLLFMDAVVAYGEEIIIPMSAESEEGSVKDVYNVSDNYPEEYLYRTEFIAGTKLENIMVDNSSYKNQYIVKLGENRKYASVVLDETHVNGAPLMVQKGMKLLADVDRIKCNSIFKIADDTGKISRVLNYDEILNNWKKFKAKFNQIESVKSFSKTQNDIDTFIRTVESLIMLEHNLVKDYDTKMFYEVFFTPYLVGKGDFSVEYRRTLYSVIFEKEPVEMIFTPTVIEETDEFIKVRRVSEMVPNTINLDKIIGLYDERIKPTVHYNFSEYKYSYRETLVWDKKKNILKETHITVIEEVKNNVQLVIDFNLKMVE